MNVVRRVVCLTMRWRTAITIGTVNPCAVSAHAPRSGEEEEEAVRFFADSQLQHSTRVDRKSVV